MLFGSWLKYWLKYTSIITSGVRIKEVYMSCSNLTYFCVTKIRNGGDNEW